MKGADGRPPVLVEQQGKKGADDAGFSVDEVSSREFKQQEWWRSEALPEPMRVKTGHDGSHPLLTHEFVDALMRNRRPAIDIELALAMTAPAIVAHESAVQNGRQLEIPEYYA